MLQKLLQFIEQDILGLLSTEVPLLICNKNKCIFIPSPGDKLSHWHHSVWFERNVRRIDFVVIFFQWTQNWTALNFEVNFQPLIQPYSSRLINNFCWGGWALLSVSKLERQRTSGTQKRSKSDFMHCRKFTFWPARNLKKEFRVKGFPSKMSQEEEGEGVEGKKQGWIKLRRIIYDEINRNNS